MKKIKQNLVTYLLIAIFVSPALVLAQPSLKKPNTEINFEENIDLENPLITMQTEMEYAFVLMQERLALIHEIARYKWQNKLPALLSNKELLSINSTNEASTSILSAFVQGQNNAALLMLEEDFIAFKEKGIDKFENVLDLEKEIIPQLIALDRSLLQCATKILSQIEDESLPSFLKDLSFYSFKNEGINRQIYDAAVGPFFNN